MDLFPISLPAETLRSSKLRLEPIVGDAMEPTLRGGRDFVLCAPVTAYRSEGLYLIASGSAKYVVRCDQVFGQRQVRIMRDNPAMGSHPRVVSLETFNEMVLAVVVADLHVRDGDMLAALAGSA